MDTARFLSRPVLSLQTMLREISGFDPRILPVIPSGIFGANTHASLRSFQQVYGLPVTGIADLSTWNAVIAAHNKITPYLLPPATLPIWQTGQAIEPNEFNDHVFLVQAMLAALSRFYPKVETPALNGRLDAPTQNGLRWLQKLSSLPETGMLDTPTWHALNGLYRVTVGDGTR